ncbi:MAG: DUF4388 domain-containing protein [Myxococcota bacterium]
MDEPVRTRCQVLIVEDSATVRRVAERCLVDAGYHVVTAADGREGLERLQHTVPDLVLLDCVLPHLDGVQFAKAMRGIQNLAEVPIVLMSALERTRREQMCEEIEAADAIGKPFGPEALVAVVGHVLTKGAADRSSARMSWAENGPAVGEASDPAGEIATVLTDFLRSLDIELPTDALARTTTDELLGLANRMFAASSAEASLTGKTGHIPLGELLQLLEHQRQTGVVTTRRSSGQPIAICLREGKVDLALRLNDGSSESEDEFLLGRYLLEDRLLDGEDLQMLLRNREMGAPLLGHQLVKLGYISQEDLQRALVRQTSELIYDALRWKDGFFRFDRYVSRSEARAAALALPVAAILMEGLRRVDEWRLIEEQITNFAIVLGVRQDVLANVDQDTLSFAERQVLAAVDGVRDVRGILEHTHMGSFDACKILFQWMTAGVLQRLR